MNYLTILFAFIPAVINALRKGPHKKARTSRTGDTDVAMFRYGIMAGIHFQGGIISAGALYRDDIVITESTHVQRHASLYKVEVFPKTPVAGKLTAEMYEVTGIKHHKDYSFRKSPKNNIAVMKLNRKENEYTGLKLDTFGLSEKVGEKFTLLGWGTDTDDWGSSQTYKSLNIEILNHERCKNIHKFPYSESQEFCATNNEDNYEPYFISMGSPLVKINSDQSITLVGINSWSEHYDTDYYPNVFVKVSEFESWINNSVRSR